MSTNVWYHLVATRISGTTFLYKNTVLTASASDSHNFAAQSVLLGKYGGSNSNYWNGKISNVKIYKGKGLTATEVLQNYQPLKTRLVLYVKIKSTFNSIYRVKKIPVIFLPLRVYK